MPLKQRYLNSSVDPENKQDWNRFLIDLNATLKDIYAALNDTMPEYADNATAVAAGLKPGDWYRTTDTVKKVHS